MASFKGAGRILRICPNAVQPCYVKLLSKWRGGVRSLLERHAAKEMVGRRLVTCSHAMEVQSTCGGAEGKLRGRRSRTAVSPWFFIEMKS